MAPRSRCAGATLLVAAGLAPVGGCQLAVGKRGVAEHPRKSVEVRVALDALSPEVGAVALPALAAQRNIHVEPQVVADASATLVQRCGLAKAAGFDYLALVQLNASESVEFKCIEYSFQLHGGCAETGASFKGAVATVSLDMYEVASCRPYTNLRRGARKWTSLKGQPGIEKASAAVLASVGPAFAGLFPDQVILDAAAHVPSSEPVRGEGVFRDYRENHYVGSLRVEAAGTERERQKLLTCCFQPRPRDLLFKSDSDRVLEFVPGPSVARVSIGGVPHIAGGFGIDLGLRGREGGPQFGVMLEELLTSESTHVLGTVEAGYGFRPTPRWALSLIAGGGGGIASRRNAPAGEADAHAVHAMATLRAQVQAGSQWFLRLDAGYVWSSTYDGGAAGPPETFLLRGPLLRLGGGLI